MTRQLPLSSPAAEIADEVGGQWSASNFADAKTGKTDGYVQPRSYPLGTILKAWMPFAILSVFVLVWGLPPVKLAMNQATTPAFRVVLA